MPVCTKKVQGGTISPKFASRGMKINQKKIIKNCVVAGNTTLDTSVHIKDHILGGTP